MALRAIKLWAKAQGLYSNVLGYLGGFSWAVLVAKACIDMHQSLPEGGFDATHVIRSFFHLFSTWHWPQPVSLVEINPADKYHQQQMDHLATTRNLFSWNPEKYPSDASHVSFFDRELRAGPRSYYVVGGILTFYFFLLDFVMFYKMYSRINLDRPH